MTRHIAITCCLLLLIGCREASQEDVRSTPGDAPAPANTPVNPDDPAAVEALEAAGATFRRDGSGHITEVSLRGSEATDDALKHVAGLKNLKSLLLNDVPISDEGLAHLVDLQAPLTNLDLRGTAVSNSGLRHIVHLQTLRGLRFSGESGSTTVDDEGMQFVAELANLKALALDNLWVGDLGIEKLKGLANLEELYLASTTIGDDALKLAQQFPKLKKLRISQNQITDAGLAHLAGNTTLEELDLSENSQLTDAGLAHLADLTGLKKLNLWRLGISDAGVSHLAALVNLEWLNLDNTRLSDAGLPALKDMAKLKFLHLGSTQISDAGLPALTPLKSLDDLKVTRTAVTETGVQELQQALPDTEIQLKYIEGQ